MREKITWVHLSDLHLKENLDNWGQNVVLGDMAKDLAERCQELGGSDFLLVTGDLAFHGIGPEYALVEEFLKDLAAKLSLDMRRVFCVPGNHDIDRTRKVTCHKGVRQSLDTEIAVEQFLGNQAERQDLLERQSAFRAFSQRNFNDQHHEWTPEGLAYVSELDLDGIRVCVVGLDSTWASAGGDEDDRHILIGDRQVINAMEVLQQYDPLFFVGAVHHPTDWLCHFDRVAVEARLLTMVDFLHHGHLHEPDTRHVSIAHDESCILVGAGAGHSGRHAPNGYSIVVLDLAEASCEIRPYEYTPHKGKFEPLPPTIMPSHLKAHFPGTFGDLVNALQKVVATSAPFSHYIAAAILGKTDDYPACGERAWLFASQGFINGSPNNEAKAACKTVLAIRNLLSAFDKSVNIEARVVAVKDRVVRYTDFLKGFVSKDAIFAAEMKRRNGALRAIAEAPPPTAFGHTLQLFDDLMRDQAWAELEARARRYCDSKSVSVRIKARLRLAVALAATHEPEKCAEALELALSLMDENPNDDDAVSLAVTLLQNAGRASEAREILLKAMKSGARSVRLIEVARLCATETGDRELRKAIDACVVEKESNN